MYDKNNTTKNQQSAKQYKKYDKTFAYYRVGGNRRNRYYINKFSNMEKLCYDCGMSIEKGELTREHIPAQCFFVGYGEEFKVNRITIPAHKTCNQYYSKIDQELRDAIGVMTNNQTDKRELVSKSLKSLFSKKEGIERLSFEDGTISMNFNYGIFRELHLKNFKGLFFNKYKIPLPKRFKIKIITEGDQEIFSIEQVSYLYNAINYNFPKWEKSGHSDIFKYKIVVFDQNGNFCDFDINSTEQTIFSIMVYHEELICFGFAATELTIKKFTTK